VLFLDLLEVERLSFLNPELDLASSVTFVTSVSSTAKDFSDVDCMLLHCVLLQVFLDLLRRGSEAVEGNEGSTELTDLDLE
jgi:hypothetical protein